VICTGACPNQHLLTLFEHMMPAHQRGRGSAELDRFLLLSADRLHLGDDVQMKLVILAAAVFFGFYAPASATAILAIWFPDYVVIGADAREVIKDGPAREISKISIIDNVIVGEAG
jgi:hypothetical protein